MDSSLLRAGRATHLKIALVSLAATIVVVIVGINARTANVDTASTATGSAVVKAGQTTGYAGNESATVR